MGEGALEGDEVLLFLFRRLDFGGEEGAESGGEVGLEGFVGLAVEGPW